MTIKKTAFSILGLMLLASACTRTQAPSDDFHQVYRKEIARLDEVLNILDQHGESIWPGWSTYIDVPCIFEYENNVRLAVGFPDTPQGFELVKGVDIRGKKIYLDRKNEIPVELAWPVSGGGGIRPFQTVSGKQMPCVHMTMRMTSKPGKAQEQVEAGISDDQILILIHEFFHVFQGEFYIVPRHGNLRYNPDTNYALYSEIEGEALLRAFDSEDPDEAKKYLKDFVVARKNKYKSMIPLEQIQEKEDDFAEGTARYAEYAALLNMAESYTPLLSQKDDPYFKEFQDLKIQFEKRRSDLERDKGDTFGSRSKCYQYGCFQALLLTRFVPGWQKTIPQENRFLFDILEEYLDLSLEEEREITEKLKIRYDFNALQNKHFSRVSARDQAHDGFFSQKGKVYIINFKPINEFVIPLPHADSELYRKGLRSVYTKGIKEIRIKDVLFEGSSEPCLQDQLFYIKYIDTKNQGYSIESERQDGDIHYNAVIKTNGFTLKAPAVRIKETDQRVKFSVLSKVSNTT